MLHIWSDIVQFLPTLSFYKSKAFSTFYNLKPEFFRIDIIYCWKFINMNEYITCSWSQNKSMWWMNLYFQCTNEIKKNGASWNSKPVKCRNWLLPEISQLAELMSRFHCIEIFPIKNHLIFTCIFNNRPGAHLMGFYLFLFNSFQIGFN